MDRGLNDIWLFRLFSVLGFSIDPINRPDVSLVSPLYHRYIIAHGRIPRIGPVAKVTQKLVKGNPLGRI